MKKYDMRERLMLEVHEVMERYSEIEEFLKKPRESYVWDEFSLGEKELQAIEHTNLSKEAITGIEKYMKQCIMDSFFDIFTIMDGVGDPDFTYGQDDKMWFGIRLSETTVDDEEEYDMMLHDQLYDIYWEWLELKKKKRD